LVLILNTLLENVNNLRAAEARAEPWQEFDLIGGISTGGLLAIMLGRLRMSLAQCEELYSSLSEKIFIPRHSKANVLSRGTDLSSAKARFSEIPLEDSIDQAIKDAREDKNVLLRDSRPDACKVLVSLEGF
jgi:patatin-like phospholipase/acyl hydrolase